MTFKLQDIRDLYRAELMKTDRLRDPFPNDADRKRPRLCDLPSGRPRPASYKTKGSTKR